MILLKSNFFDLIKDNILLINGQFKDRSLEKEFRKDLWPDAYPKYRLLMYISMIVYFFIGLIDNRLQSDSFTAGNILFLRFLACSSGFLAIMATYRKNSTFLLPIASAIFFFFIGANEIFNLVSSIHRINVFCPMFLLMIIIYYQFFACDFIYSTISTSLISIGFILCFYFFFDYSDILKRILIVVTVNLLGQLFFVRMASMKRVYYLLDKNKNDLIIELRRLSYKDELTGISNRRAFFETIALEWAKFSRHENIFSLISIDLDHFKRVNDRYGHDAGDLALKVFVKTCKKELREGDFFARTGGEEFSIILANTKSTGGLIIAERIRAAVNERTFYYKDNNVSLSISLGLVESSLSHSSRDLIYKADMALYLAKNKGRNRVELYKPPEAIN